MDNQSIDQFARDSRAVLLRPGLSALLPECPEWPDLN